MKTKVVEGKRYQYYDSIKELPVRQYIEYLVTGEFAWFFKCGKTNRPPRLPANFMDMAIVESIQRQLFDTFPAIFNTKQKQTFFEILQAYLRFRIRLALEGEKWRGRVKQYEYKVRDFQKEAVTKLVDKDFESMHITLTKKFNQDTRNVTVFTFYTMIEMWSKEIEQSLSKDIKHKRLR